MTGEVTSYTEMVTAIQHRVEALGVRLVDFDDLAGFPSGLSGKVFGPSQVKRLGPEKLFDALRAAGLRLKVEEDPEQAEKMRARIAENYNPRQANQARNLNQASPVSTQLLSRCFKHLSRLGTKKRWAGKSKRERSEHARMMAMAKVRKDRKRAKAAHLRRRRERERAPAACPR